MRTHTAIDFGEQARCTPVTERGDASVHCGDCWEHIATGGLDVVGGSGERGPNPTAANGVDAGTATTPPPPPNQKSNVILCTKSGYGSFVFYDKIILLSSLYNVL